MPECYHMFRLEWQGHLSWGTGEDAEGLHKWHSFSTRQRLCEEGKVQSACPFFRRTRWGPWKLPKDSQPAGKWIPCLDSQVQYLLAHPCLLGARWRNSVIMSFPWRVCVWCGVGGRLLCTIMCVISLAYMQQPPFFLNLKVTLLEAPNVELTLNWKEDLFRARALFLWIFCLTNHGECEPGEKSVKGAAHSFQGAEELFWRRKVCLFSWPFDPLGLRGRKTWGTTLITRGPPTCCWSREGTGIKHKETSALVLALKLTTSIFHTIKSVIQYLFFRGDELLLAFWPIIKHLPLLSSVCVSPTVTPPE